MEAGTILATPRSEGTRGDDLMSKLLRGLAAGYGAKKLGGGIFTTILIFIVLWMVLGNFDIFS
jgi:hypothetical protein